jgi:hypothetical protein
MSREEIALPMQPIPDCMSLKIILAIHQMLTLKAVPGLVHGGCTRHGENSAWQ